MLQFLENKRWDNTQTNFDRRVDSIFLSTVKNIQSSIKNAPDNMIGMVKGFSDNIITDAFSKINTISSTNQMSSGSNIFHPDLYTSIQSKDTEINTQNSSFKNYIKDDDLNYIERTALNDDETLNSNNLPVRLILVLIDEIFDLKEKNQWIRQSLMSIVKSFMKNFKGDTMNKKIKEQIADYLNEENMARYLKNFRKQIWPKGYLAKNNERTSNMKIITKIIAKTKLLATVSGISIYFHFKLNIDEHSYINLPYGTFFLAVEFIYIY